MNIQFWGTRGSIPKPGRATMRYGGNTPCLEVRSARGTLVIIDCGTGLHNLGQRLLSGGAKGLIGHVLISHTHWDHIQGIPFFAPFFVPGNRWQIYGPMGLDQSLRETLAGQMQHTYFPITPDQFGATIRYHDLLEGAFEIDDIKVTTQYLNHPALTLGYRLEADGVTVAYCSDHEPFSRAVAEGQAEFTGQDQRHAEFVEGADLLIHDAQYTALEYPSKVGWGHSSGEFVVNLARRARVKAVALTHHDPLRTDGELDAVVERLRASLPEAGPSLDIFAAAENRPIHISPSSRGASAPSDKRSNAMGSLEPALADRCVILSVVDPDIGKALVEAARAEGISAEFFSDVETGRALLADRKPSLVMIQHCETRRDGMSLCRAIRAADGGQVPLVIVSDREDAASAISAGATDWLIAPFSSSYARTKMRAWVLRVACRWVKAPIPEDEQTRLASLRELSLLDTDPNEKFDRVTRLAAACFDAPMSTITLIDQDRQWFMSSVGTSTKEDPRDASFCAHVVHSRRPMIVADTLLDSRFADNPLVVNQPRIRFYAGYPLTLDNGSCIGTLCVLDTRPRAFQQSDFDRLRDLASIVVEEVLHIRSLRQNEHQHADDRAARIGRS